MINKSISIKIIYWGLGIGDWGLGIWGLGIGPNPQPPIPNPQIYKNKLIAIKIKYRNRQHIIYI